MKYLNFVLPVIITLLSIIGIIASYGAGNDSALSAYVVALSGWMVIATDEVIKFIDSRRK